MSGMRATCGPKSLAEQRVVVWGGDIFALISGLERVESPSSHSIYPSIARSGAANK